MTKDLQLLKDLTILYGSEATSTADGAGLEKIFEHIIRSSHLALRAIRFISFNLHEVSDSELVCNRKNKT